VASTQSKARRGGRAERRRVGPLRSLVQGEHIEAESERLKQASRSLLASLRELLEPMRDWTQNTSTQAEVKVFILDSLWQSLPRPPVHG
jgi:hypothetical protein